MSKLRLSVLATTNFSAWEVETGWWFGIGEAEVFVTHEDADKIARAILFHDEDEEPEDE